MEVKNGYKKTEVGVIPEDWKILSISEIGETKRGAGSQYIKYLQMGGIRLIRINDFFEDNPVYVEPTSEVMRFTINENDLLFAGTGASAGASYSPPKEWIGLPHSYNAPRIRINNQFSKEYILYSLQSEIVLKQQRAGFVGAAQPFLDTRAIAGFQIPLPPTLTEQLAIATALSDTDALIAALDRLIAKKKAIKQGAMQELLTGKRRLEGFEGEWVMKRLGDLFQISAAGDLDRDGFSGFKDGQFQYPIYSNSLSDEGLYGYSNHFDYGEGNITVTARGTIGFAVFRQTKFTAIGRLLVLQSLDRLNGIFLSEYINLRLEFAIESTGVPQLTAPQIAKYKVNIPSNIEEQTAIAQILTDMDAEIAALERRRDKYKAVKVGMMQELLTGKTRLV